MKILLDTHVLLWTITGDTRISDDIRFMIGSARNDMFFSLASVWECDKAYKQAEGYACF